MTINDNSTKSINAAIIDLQNQIKQLQHKIGILSKNQLKECDIEFPDKVEYAKATKTITTVSTATTKYIKLADCLWNQTGTMEVYLFGNSFEDTLIINYGGGNGSYPMLCGHYTSHNNSIISVIAQKGSTWKDNYSIWIEILQRTTATVDVTVLRGSCTINISETTTEPTNIIKWNTGRGYWGTFNS